MSRTTGPDDVLIETRSPSWSSPFGCDIEECSKRAVIHITVGSAHQWYCDRHGEAVIDVEYPWYWETV